MTLYLQTEALCITAVSGGSSKEQNPACYLYGMAWEEVLAATIHSNYKVEDLSLCESYYCHP